MDPGFRRDDGTSSPSSPQKRGPSDFASPHKEKALGSRFRGNDEGVERKPRRGEPETGFETFRIEVGHDHGVKPGNIVGAIANEAGLDAKHIGRVDIRGDHSFVDLPEGMPSDVFKHLKKVWVSGQQLRITRGGEEGQRPSRPAPRKPPPSGFAAPKRQKPGKRRG